MTIYIHTHVHTHIYELKCKVQVAQSCPTLFNPMDYTVRGILQARILEWVANSPLQVIFPTQESNPGLLHCRQTLPAEPQGKPIGTHHLPLGPPSRSPPADSSPLGCHGAPGWALCVTQRLPTSYPSYLHTVAYMCQCCFHNASHLCAPLLWPTSLLFSTSVSLLVPCK